MNHSASRTWFLAALLLAFPVSGFAVMGVGVRGGTTGVGGEVAVELVSDYLNLRVAGNGGAVDVELEEDDADYDCEISLNNWLAVLDWHVAGGPFKLVAGACYNGNQVEGRADPTEPIKVGNVRFTPAQIGSLYADADYDSFGGYAGIGFGNLAQGGQGHWTASIDLGVMFFSDPDLSLESRGGTLTDTALVNRQLQNEIDDFEDDYESWMTFYPVLTVGLAYRF